MGTPTITGGTGGSLPNLLNGYSLGVQGPAPKQQVISATSVNPGGCVSFGSQSDIGSNPGTSNVTNAAFPSGKCMQFPAGTGAAFMFGSLYSNIVPYTNFLIVEWEQVFGTGANAPDTSGDWKWLRLRGPSGGYAGGSLISQGDYAWLYWDCSTTVINAANNYRALNGVTAALCDGHLHRLRMEWNAVAAPNEHISLYVDGVLQTGTYGRTYDDVALTTLVGTGGQFATYHSPGATIANCGGFTTVPAAPWISWFSFFETVNVDTSTVGVRQVDRVWASTVPFTSQP